MAPSENLFHGKSTKKNFHSHSVRDHQTDMSGPVNGKPFPIDR